MTATVGSALADVIAGYGAKHFFLLTGGDNAFLLDLHDRGVKHVLARSERSAAFMADAYARLTGQAAFVYGQFGPGAAVALSGLIEAQLGGSPVVGIMSEAKTEVRHRRAYQELDQVAMFGAFAKWAARLERPDRAPDMMARAIREAVSGAPGASYLGVPSDLLLVPYLHEGVPVDLGHLVVPPHRPRPSTGSVEQAARLIAGASRPVVLAGTGCMASRAWDALDDFARAHRIPVVTSVGGKGAMAETGDLCHGVAGRYSRRSANEVLRSADVVIAVGTRLNDMTTDRGKAMPPNATIVHVDIEPTSFGLNVPAAVEVLGDAQATLVDLSAALGAARYDEWAEAAAGITRGWLSDREAEESRLTGSPVSPIAVMAALRNCLSEDDMVVSDTGHMSAWTAVLFDAKRPGVTHLRTAGSLGWALPASLGAQLAAPERRVVAVTGDGGAGYHLADLETAARLNLPVVFVVINNGTLAFEKHVQERIIGRIEPDLINFADTDFAAAAKALGVGGVRVTDRCELEPAIRAALAAGGPVLVDVISDPGADAPVTNYEHLQRKVL